MKIQIGGKQMRPEYYWVWIFLLLLELITFFYFAQSVTVNEICFFITTIIVTLVVGAVGLLGFKNNE